MKIYTIFILFMILWNTTSFAQDITYPYTWTTDKNPVVTHIYTADPSAKVFKDGTIWVFASHDATEARAYRDMKDYHFFSTKDMQTWTDHGVALSVDDISWAEDNLWAPDAVERNGKYYLYAPANFKIGVFISDKPEGPYVDVLNRPLIPIDDAIDPMVFIDEDGQAYMYFSRRGIACYVVKLKENMIETEGLIYELTNKSIRSTINGEYNFQEGPFVHKRNGIYYLTYPAKQFLNDSIGSRYVGYESLCYATSDNPLGPFEFKGRISDDSGVHTIHQSIISYQDEDYMFYHNRWLFDRNGGPEKYAKYRRSMCVNKITYNEDGSINFMEQTEEIFD